MSLEMAMAVADASPPERIAKGDVALGSVFVQLHAARIVLAVQEGLMRAEKQPDGRYLLKLTDAGRTFFKVGAELAEV